MLDSSVSGKFSVQRVIDTAVDDNDNWSEVNGLPNNGFAGLPGTAASNNFNDNSHYRLVERPLERYLNGEGMKLGHFLMR